MQAVASSLESCPSTGIREEQDISIEWNTREPGEFIDVMCKLVGKHKNIFFNKFLKS